MLDGESDRVMGWVWLSSPEVEFQLQLLEILLTELTCFQF